MSKIELYEEMLKEYKQERKNILDNLELVDKKVTELRENLADEYDCAVASVKE